MDQARYYYKNKDFKEIFVRTKSLESGDILLTNDYGNWLSLSKSEYRKIVFQKIDKNLFDRLESNLLILTDKNESDIVNKFKNYEWHIPNGTSLHILIPTLRCNFTCKYCYALRCEESESNKDMTPETMDKTVDFIFKSPANTYVFEFSGGEPLLRFDLVKQAILRAENKQKNEFPEKKVLFSIVTNASLLTPEIIDFFRIHRVGICTSIDGPEDIHDGNRRFTKDNKPSYASVIKSLNYLKEIKYPSVNAIPVILKDSLDRWKDIIDHYVELGFTTLRFKFVSHFGFASNAWKSMAYTPEEFLAVWRKVIDYILELNKKGIPMAENLSAMMLQKILHQQNPGYAELQRPCGAVTGQIVYNYDGAIFTCDEARTMPEFQIGDVFTSEYVDLLNCSVTKTLHNISNLTATCDECPYFSFCGICPLEIYVQEKGFITNIPSNYRCRIHKGMFDYLFEKINSSPEAKELLMKWADVRGGNIASIPDKEMQIKLNPFSDYIVPDEIIKEDIKEDNKDGVNLLSNDEKIKKPVEKLDEDIEVFFS